MPMKKPDLRSSLIRPSFDPQKLQLFLSVYECRAFSSAALENGVSQQAVSKSVARLEDSLGLSLFERGPTGAEPTQFAHVLARRAKTIIAEGRLAVAELSALRGSGKGYVRIGLGWSFLPRIGPALVERFRKRYPDVTVSIASGDSKSLYHKLVSGDVEWVASAPPSDLPLDPTLERRKLFIDQDMLVMRKGHPLAGKGMPPLPLLTQQPWMISAKLVQQWQRICDCFSSEGVEPPQTHVDLDSVILLKSMLLQSDGVALLSPELFSLEHEKDQFHAIRDTPFVIPRTASIATRRNSKQQPVARALIEDLDNVWRKLIDTDLHL